MASPRQVIETLSQRGVFLRALPDGKLHIKGTSKLTDAERATIRAHKAALIKALATSSQQGSDTQLPENLCTHCGGGHYWRHQDRWVCSSCQPMPANFQGHSVTVHGGKQSHVSNVTQSQLEKIHPAVVQGIPLNIILDKCEESDYQDLLSRSTLEALVRSMIASATLDPRRYLYPDCSKGSKP